MALSLVAWREVVVALPSERAGRGGLAAKEATMKDQVEVNGGKCTLRWPGILKGAGQERCTGMQTTSFMVTTNGPAQSGMAAIAPKKGPGGPNLLTIPRRIAYSVNAVATAQTRAVMDKLVAASKQACSRVALANNVGEILSSCWTENGEEFGWDMHACYRARSVIHRHCPDACSPEDKIDLSMCSRDVLRWATCGATKAFSVAPLKGQYAMQLAQRCMSAAAKLRATPVPEDHAAAMKLFNDVLGDQLASLRAFDPLLPWWIAHEPSSIESFRECTWLLTAQGIFSVAKKFEEGLTDGLRALDFVGARNASEKNLYAAGVRVVHRAIRALEPCVLSSGKTEPNMATWMKGRPFLLSIIAQTLWIEPEELGDVHRDWERVAAEEAYRRQYGRPRSKPAGSVLIH